LGFLEIKKEIKKMKKTLIKKGQALENSQKKKRRWGLASRLEHSRISSKRK